MLFRACSASALSNTTQTSWLLWPVFWYSTVAVCGSPGNRLSKLNSNPFGPLPPEVWTWIEPVVPVISPCLDSLK